MAEAGFIAAQPFMPAEVILSPCSQSQISQDFMAAPRVEPRSYMGDTEQDKQYFTTLIKAAETGTK